VTKLQRIGAQVEALEAEFLATGSKAALALARMYYTRQCELEREAAEAAHRPEALP